MSSLNNHKTVGPNSISTNILKLLNKNISNHLASLSNLSLLSGIFTKILKTSKIIPIDKKDSKLNCSNYWPISLLSNVDKILERIMYNKLYTFLEKKRTYYSFQCGFRQKHSTTHALVHLIEWIRKQFGDGNYDCGIFIDFQKTFDTVDHDILLKKLKRYCIRVISNKWFASYLTNRNRFASINGFNLALADTICRQPPGSILDPLPFLVDMTSIVQLNIVKYTTYRWQ